MTISVIIITYNRPDLIERCLPGVLGQLREGDEALVVDASKNDATRKAVERYPPARYVHSEIANMPSQRNLGIESAAGEVVAFIDDDCVVREGWRDALESAFRDDRVGAAGGQVVDAEEPADPKRSVGVIAACGKVVGNFGVPIAAPRPVAHLQGCNMAFRREVCVRAGGFDPHYSGSSICEDTDIFPRVKALGFSIWLVPGAALEHRRAVQAGYDRNQFNLRYAYHSAKTTTYFFFKYFFWGRAWAYLVRDTAVAAKRYISRALTVALHTVALGCAHAAGKLAGIALAVRYHLKGRRQALRRSGDAAGRPGEPR